METLVSTSHTPQFWRGQVALQTTWAQRIDPVTTWAMTVVVFFSSAVLFSDRPHTYFMALPFLLIPFSCMEAQRYMVYARVGHRAELFQKGYFVPLLQYVQHKLLHTVKPDELKSDHDPAANHNNNKNYTIDVPWQQQLVDSFDVTCDPEVSFAQAWCIRYKRVYVGLLYLTLVMWYVKIALSTVVVSSGIVAAMIIVPILLTLLTLLVHHQGGSFSLYGV